MKLARKSKKELITLIEQIKDDAYREWQNVDRVCKFSAISVVVLGLICLGLIIASFLGVDSEFLVCSQDKTTFPHKDYSKFLNNFSSYNLDNGEGFSHHNADKRN